MQTEPTMERLRARKEAKLRQKLAVLICGPTGTGKTFVSCALGEQTCRQGHRVLYMRVPRLLEDLALAHADGTDARVLQRLLRTDLLILDDWGIGTLTEPHSRDRLEMLEDRYDRGAPIVASLFPVERWHGWLANSTLADATLDRLIHRSHRVVPKGPSKRKEFTDSRPK